MHSTCTRRHRHSGCAARASVSASLARLVTPTRSRPNPHVEFPSARAALSAAESLERALANDHKTETLDNATLFIPTTSQPADIVQWLAMHRDRADLSIVEVATRGDTDRRDDLITLIRAAIRHGG